MNVNINLYMYELPNGQRFLVLATAREIADAWARKQGEARLIEILPKLDALVYGVPTL